jgi:hypothetical protein
MSWLSTSEMLAIAGAAAGAISLLMRFKIGQYILIGLLVALCLFALYEGDFPNFDIGEILIFVLPVTSY